MGEQYAYLIYKRSEIEKAREQENYEPEYEHLCIDEGTAGLYCETPSMFEVRIITWEN